ncbi:ubiquitin-conjugating enzyme E2 U isoform X3 [Elephas maximus indicus]|uniref:ubiquitin-conjugating enzyme E2 U isoform X3 n=1 Tax=Elephas maximus indicus TaxID=99487 RepID=UPI0021163726|nr:ubiquitin-conjugating enzyme E2 U isoform X3 [Elephas maximus indicus]
MHCRAYLLLERDFQELMENNYKVMLSNPVLENPVNLEAARMLMADESLYQITVLKLFNQPLQLGNGSSVSSEEPQEFVKSVKDVSFNDYYETWSVIATSNTTEYYRTPVLQDPDFIGRYYQWKKTDLKQAKEWRLKYVATLSQLTRENKTPQKSKYPTTRIHVGPTPVTLYSTKHDVLLQRLILPDNMSKIKLLLSHKWKQILLQRFLRK